MGAPALSGINLSHPSAINNVNFSYPGSGYTPFVPSITLKSKLMPLPRQIQKEEQDFRQCTTCCARRWEGADAKGAGRGYSQKARDFPFRLMGGAWDRTSSQAPILLLSLALSQKGSSVLKKSVLGRSWSRNVAEALLKHCKSGLLSP